MSILGGWTWHPALIRAFGWRVFSGENFDAGVLVEVADDAFAVVFLDFEAVEPEFVVLGVGVPRAGFFLAEADDDAFDADGVGAGAHGDLLGDADARAGRVGFVGGLVRGRVVGLTCGHGASV